VASAFGVSNSAALKRREMEDSFMVDGERKMPVDLDPLDNVDLSGVEHVASLEEAIPASNKGYQLLMKMGWKKGKGVGKYGQGRVDPVPLFVLDGQLGLGKAEEYKQMTEMAAAQRRQLETEIEEGREIQKVRLEMWKEKQRREVEVKEMNKQFYCEICNKQYKTVKEMESHLSSYDHHHTKRLKEMKEMYNRSAPTSQKKLKKREEKEMKKLAEKAKALAASTSQPPLPPPVHEQSAMASSSTYDSVVQHGNPPLPDVPPPLPARAAPTTGSTITAGVPAPLPSAGISTEAQGSKPIGFSGFMMKKKGAPQLKTAKKQSSSFTFGAE